VGGGTGTYSIGRHFFHIIISLLYRSTYPPSSLSFVSLLFDAGATLRPSAAPAGCGSGCGGLMWRKWGAKAGATTSCGTDAGAVASRGLRQRRRGAEAGKASSHGLRRGA